jgi:outer membrane protein OmpA-like peptidoglycan-associated protein
MRTFAQQQNQPQKSGDAKLARPNWSTRGRDHREQSLVQLQHAPGYQAVLRLSQTQPEEPGIGSTTVVLRTGHDFSRIPIHPPAAGAIQTKLAVNRPGDDYEQEADRVAEQVMRIPEPPAQARVQTKRIQVGGTGQIAAPPMVHDVVRSPGQLLNPATRAFMEPRFGYDFSRVRVHADAKAAESAGALTALAYTVGQDVVFGAGQYQPNTSAGQQLLAHELSHTIQQGAALRQSPLRQPIRKSLVQARLVQTPIIARKNDAKAGPSHRANDKNQLKSELHPSGVAHLYADQVASIYFGIKSYVPDQDDHKALKALAEEYRYTAQRLGGLKGVVIGHADIEASSDPDNQELSFQRARWTAAVLKTYLEEAARGSLTDFQFDVEGAGTRFCMGDPDCKAKARSEALAQYRRADVIIYSKATPNPGISSCPPTSEVAVKSLAEYIELIRCAEVKTGYSPRQMLAMLRQMYYGEDWSASSLDKTWKYVIPCSPNLGNPQGMLGDRLYKALHNSIIVEGTDLGHIFTGLEAMTCPSSSVTVEKSKFGIGIELRVDLSNESFATWGGDLGSVAGAMVACWMMTNEERANKGKKDCHQGSSPQGLMDYFMRLASPGDLEGDIAPFAMRAAELGACGGSLETQFTPQAPISSMFPNFFFNRGFAGRTSKDRYRCFAEAIGANVVNGKINNRAALRNKYEQKVLSFAWAYYINLKKEIPRSDPVVPMLVRQSQGALNLFFDWLQARMQE